MSTPEVKLVPALPKDLDVWIAMRHGPTSRRLLPLDGDNREALLKRLSEASSDVTDPRAKNFRWMVEANGQIAGMVSARELSRCHGRIEIGYMLAEEFIGRGVGTRAVTLLLERLFTIPEFQRVWLTTIPENLASQGLARKLGFVQEGLLRGHCIVQGRRTDQQVWGLLRPEWERIRAHGR